MTQGGSSTHWGAPINTKETIDAVLALKTWAVVGLGNNPERAAFGVAKLLQDKGHRIIPIHPSAEVVHGEIGYKTLFEIPEPIDVVGYVRWLEQVLIDSISELGLYTERVEGRSGVWAPVGDTHVKIAAIGIRVAEKVTMHGFALNCNNSLDAYETIIACGIKDAATSTISKLLNREVTPAMAAEIIQKRLVEIEKVSK